MVSDRIFRLAYETSISSQMRHKLGTVIYRSDKEIVATGFNRALAMSNRRIWYRKQKVYAWSVHSEIAALLKAVGSAGINYHKILKGCKVYIHRSNGRLAMPCPPCFSALLSAGINEKDIEWSDCR